MHALLSLDLQGVVRKNNVKFGGYTMIEMNDWKEMKERLDFVADGYYPSQAYKMIIAHLVELAQGSDGAELDLNRLES